MAQLTPLDRIIYRKGAERRLWLKHPFRSAPLQYVCNLNALFLCQQFVEVGMGSGKTFLEAHFNNLVQIFF
jgi:hypothetical protein